MLSPLIIGDEGLDFSDSLLIMWEFFIHMYIREAAYLRPCRTFLANKPETIGNERTRPLPYELSGGKGTHVHWSMGFCLNMGSNSEELAATSSYWTPSLLLRSSDLRGLTNHIIGLEIRLPYTRCLLEMWTVLESGEDRSGMENVRSRMRSLTRNGTTKSN